MEKTQKIQCPNCGASSSFETIRTGSYKCGYCYSHWEQATLIPEQNVAIIFRDLIIQLFEEDKELTPERPKYVERSFNHVLGIYTYMIEIKDVAVIHSLLPKFREMVDVQIRYYESRGITKNTRKEELIARKTDDEGFVMHHFLAAFYSMLSKIESQYYTQEEHLQMALEYSNFAQKLRSQAIDDFEEEMAAAHFGVLQRLGDQNVAFAWLDNLLHRFPEQSIEEDLTVSLGYAPDDDDIAAYKKQINNYKEEVTLLFEDVIFSRPFQDWKNNKL